MNKLRLLPSILRRTSNVNRCFATETNPLDWDNYPNTAKHSVAECRDMMMASLGEDEGHGPRVYRQKHGDIEMPNKIPMRGSSRIVGCTCTPESSEMHYMTIERDKISRCPCGYLFKGVAITGVTHTKKRKFY